MSLTSQPPLLTKFLRTKAIGSGSGSGMHRTLSAWDLVVFGVSAMIGTGIFVLTGEAAANAAGPALVISIVLTAVLCGFCALCYSELSAAIPVSGSAYAYIYTCMGEFAAWLTGWILVTEYMASVMTIAMGWGRTITHFLHTMLHIDIPVVISQNTIEVLEQGQQAAQPSLVALQQAFTLPGSSEPLTLVLNQSFNLLPFLGLLVVTYLLCKGIEDNAKFATAMVYIKTAVIVLFIISSVVFLVAHPQILHANWFANGWQTFAPFGWDGIAKGAALMFFAYVGFDALACSAEEAKNPARDLPIGIIGSLIICSILYALVTAGVTGVVPLAQIDKEAAVIHAMGMMNIPIADWIVNIGAIAGISSVLLVLQMACVRATFAIARDGLLPKALATINERIGAPLTATLLIGAINALGAGLLPLTLLAHIANLGTLFAFMMVCLAVVALRVTQPLLDRPFKIPGGIAIALCGAVGCFAMMLQLSSLSWVIGLIITIIGVGIYLGYGQFNSRLNS